MLTHLITAPSVLFNDDFPFILVVHDCCSPYSFDRRWWGWWLWWSWWWQCGNNNISFNTYTPKNTHTQLLLKLSVFSAAKSDFFLPKQATEATIFTALLLRLRFRSEKRLSSVKWKSIEDTFVYFLLWFVYPIPVYWFSGRSKTLVGGCRWALVIKVCLFVQST